MTLLVFVVPLLVAGLLAVGRASFGEGGDRHLRRLLPPLAGFAAVTALFAVASGTEAAGPDLVLATVAAVPLAGLALLRARRRPAVVERSWSGSPAARVDPTGVRPRSPSAPSAVARALGRVESGQLLTSPWVGIGIGFCVLEYLLFGFVYANDNGETWEGFIQLAPWLALPLVGMTVLAMHRAVTRARRDGADELLDSCPTTPATRTMGFLLPAVTPMAVLAAFFGVVLATVAVNSPHLHGPVGVDSAADLAGAIALGAGGVALGVALGRWVHFGLAPVAAVAAIGFASIGLNGVGGRGWNPLVPLSLAPAVDGTSPVFTERPTVWRVIWVVGLTAVVVIVALARYRRDRAVAVGLVAAAVVVAVAGVAATRPMSSTSAARIADLVARPEAHQECVGADGPIQLCAFPFHREPLQPMADRLAPIGAALPPGAATFTIRQVWDQDLDELPPEVANLLTEADLARPADETPLDVNDYEYRLAEGGGFDLALAVLGIPAGAGDDDLPTVLAGQARGVVAIWLATRGLDDESTDAAIPDPGPRSADELELCDVPAAVWSAQDLAAARAVLALPAVEVTDVLHARWDHWADPDTGTDELLVALGLPRVGPFDEVQAFPGRPC